MQNRHKIRFVFINNFLNYH